jgi:hypothetical protein
MRTQATKLILVVVAVLSLASSASGQARETAGVITEIKVGSGRVEVWTPARAWRAAAPLQALRTGDEIRASENASVVVLLAGGRGTARIDAKSSPFVMAAPAADEGKLGKARTLVAGTMGFLTAPKEAPKAVLATRAVARPPEVLTPRNGPVLPGTLAFEWLGSQFSRYTVRVLGPADVVLERKGVVGARFEYPPDAPRLQAGVRYRFQVVALNQPPYEAAFEVTEAARAQSVQADLHELEGALGASASPNSLAAARAGYLAEHGLLHDARLVVLAALTRDPDEPVLHTLLGTFYATTGLPQQAAEAFDEAEFLLTKNR